MSRVDRRAVERAERRGGVGAVPRTPPTRHLEALPARLLLRRSLFERGVHRDHVFWGNPYRFLRVLRDQDPVHWDPEAMGGAGVWLVSRYDGVLAVLADARFSAHMP